jgi:hypothetical protein
LLRVAMQGILPEAIRTRKLPAHFNAAFLDEFRRHWPSYEATFGPGARSEIAARGYVDAERFWARLQKLRARDAFGPDFIYLTRLAACETWLRALALPRPQRVTIPTPWEPPRSSPARPKMNALPIGSA